jgi:ABC-2 type transport system permease protein
MTHYDSSAPEFGLRESTSIFWKKRKLLQILARNDLLTRYKKSVLGILWSQINPLLTTTVIYFVFGKLINRYLPTQRGYAVYVLTGILFQTVLISGLTACGEALASNAPLLMKIRVKPIVFAFSTGISTVFNFVIGFVTVIPIALFSHQSISIRFLLIPVLLILLVFFLTGMGLLLSGFYIRFDDVRYLMGALMMIVAYLSPIFYPLSILSTRIRLLVELNPLTSWIVVIRWCTFTDASCNLWQILVVILSTAFSYIGGVYWIRSRWTNYMVMI